MIVRKVLIWATILGMWYLAGMYRSFSLLLVSILSLTLLVTATVACRVFRSRFSVGFRKQTEIAQVGLPATLTLNISNHGRLPITRYAVDLKMWYAYGARPERRTLWGSISGRTHAGEKLEVLAPMAGLLYVRLERIRIYDWLSLCRAGQSMDEAVRIAVFPAPVALQLVLPAENDGSSVRCNENQLGLIEAHEEIRQIREYRPGDLARHIHWNITARSDDVWIREYEGETDSTADLYLDLSGDTPQSEEMSRFYRLAQAVVLGLLDQVAIVTVSWHEADQRTLHRMEVHDAEECRHMLFQIYSEPLPGRSVGPVPTDAHVFRINRQLDLFQGSALIHAFREEDMLKLP